MAAIGRYDLSRDGRFLYSLNNGNGTVECSDQPDGSLEPGWRERVPTSAAGLPVGRTAQ
jgi:hypothetical protein